MVLTQLRLHDFRNYRQVSLTPPAGVTALVGENGAGKTSLLEAVHLCCLGRSHRSLSDRDLVRSGCETGAVHATVRKASRTDEAGIRLFSQSGKRKIIYINGKTAPRIGELMGHLTCVMFSPEDLEIVKGPPLARRRFIDMLLCQCEPSYFFALQKYHAVLRQRNALLRSGTGSPDRRQLSAWDEQLAEAANPIALVRRQALEKLNGFAAGHYLHISGRETEALRLDCRGTLCESPDPRETLLKALCASRKEDLFRGTTGPGPHRDELQLTLAGCELKTFGSQGQMRTAALSLRLAQIDLLIEYRGDPPLLLLDDVLSELDGQRRARLLSRLKDIQTLLTCTDAGDLRDLRPDCVLRVREGNIAPN